MKNVRWVLVAIPFFLAGMIMRALWDLNTNPLEHLAPLVAGLVSILFIAFAFRQNKGYLVAFSLQIIGGLSNLSVTLANGGFMPVVGTEKTSGSWVTATSSSKLLFLADRFSGFSLGDILLLLGVLAAVIIGIFNSILAIKRREGIENNNSRSSKFMA